MAIERDIRRGLGHADDETGVLLREQSLRRHRIERERAGKCRQHDAQRQPRMPQHDIEPVRVASQHAFECALRQTVESAVRLGGPMAEQPGTQHRRHGQRDDTGHRDRHADAYRELAEQPADDAAHQQHRDEHRDQRHRH